MGQGLRAAAMRDPSKIAVTDEAGHARTFEDYIANVNRVARYTYETLGLSRGDHAAIMCSNAIAYLEIAIGLSDAVVPPAMINPRGTVKEARHILEDSEAKVLFVEKAALETAKAAAPQALKTIICIEDDLPSVYAQTSPEPLGLDVRETDIYSIPYTSGTTGKPKGVLLSHRSRVMMMLYAQAGSYGVYNPDCRGLATTPFFNGGGFSNAITPLFFGGTCHILPRFDAARVLEVIAQKRITNMFMVPTQYQAVLGLGDDALAKADLSSLKMVLSSAAPLAQATKEKLVALFGQGVLFDSYGSTEFGAATCLRPYDQLRKQACVGLAQPGCEVTLLDEEGAQVPQGEVGQVYVRSPWFFAGYWNRPEATAECFKGDWCTVGDLGRMDEEGYLYIVDRQKNVIITGGQNVFPREIEDVLYGHDAVMEAAVVGRPDDYWGEAVVAFVALKPGQTATADDLIAFCKADMSGYKVPKDIVIRDSLPKNGTGKIMHKTLREALVAGA
ncbi:MAG: class I adenylate-forming enzyme family protein [Pseudomonadota bacterium]